MRLIDQLRKERAAVDARIPKGRDPNSYDPLDLDCVSSPDELEYDRLSKEIRKLEQRGRDRDEQFD